MRFAALFVAITSLAAGATSLAQSNDKASQQAKALNLTGLSSPSQGADVTSATVSAPSRNSISDASATPVAQISDADRQNYRFERAAIRRKRDKRFSQLRQELLGIGLSAKPSETELFDETLYTLGVAELKTLFDTRLAALHNASAGTAEYVGALRNLGLVSYFYAWSLTEVPDIETGRTIEATMDTAFAPYLAAPPPQLVLPIARHYRLKSRFAFLQGDLDGQARLIAKSGATIVSPEIYRPDYVMLARLKMRSLLDDYKASSGFKPEPCGIIDALVAIRQADASVLRPFVECQIALASDLIAKKATKNDVRSGIATLDVTREYLLQVQQRNPNSALGAGVLELSVLNELSRKEQTPPLTASIESYKYMTAERFVKILGNRPYRQNSDWELSYIYSAFSDINPNALPALQPSGARHSDIAELMLAVADAVEPSRAAYPGVPAYGLIAADSLARVAEIKLGRKDIKGADAASARAEQVMDQTRLIRALGKGVDERAQSECLVRNRRIRVLIALDRTDDALVAYRKFDQSCGDWVRKFPWEYYARQYATDITNRMGNHLRLKGRHAEAQPLLAYASNWGVKEASEGLAAIYGDQASALADAAKAAEARKLAERQSFKRFTIPTEFDKVKFPFHVYVAEYGPGPSCETPVTLSDAKQPRDPAAQCYGYAGIDDQVLWVSQLRGGVVPPDVIDSFRKLFKIARENNVSFPDLSVYALGAANRPEIAGTDAQVRVIYDAMVATKFARNPERWLDFAGLALKGHDAVSYRQGEAPVLGTAEFYALWDGALWLFKDAVNRDAFAKDPARYAPQYGGFSAWEIASDKKANSVDPAVFAIIDDKLYLFDNTDHIPDWKANAAALKAKADGAWIEVYTDKLDDASTLADRIAKLGKVPLASIPFVLVEGCKANLPGRCGKLFIYADNLCSQENSVPACNIAIILAEGFSDKSKLVSLLGNRSWYLAQANKADEAIADARRALAIDPASPWIEGNLANGLLLKGQVSEALAIYTKLKEQPGPNRKDKMCKAILEDVDTMFKAKLISDRMVEEVRRAIICS